MRSSPPITPKGSQIPASMSRLDKVKGRPRIRGAVKYDYSDVTEVALDRETRRLTVVTGGKRIVVDGVDRLYVRSLPWSEADGTVRLYQGHVSVNGNVAAAEG